MRTKQTLDEKFTEIEVSFINGQRTQAREQFKKLRVSERKQLVSEQVEAIANGNEDMLNPTGFVQFLITNL